MKKIIVVGIPRSGTTYMFRSLNGLPQGSLSPNFDKIENHFHYLNNTIKTHFPFRLLPGDKQQYKVLFVHRHLSDAIYSNVKEFNLDIRHFENCGSNYTNFLVDKIYSEDILNLETLFNNWVLHTNLPTLAIRYENISNHQKEIEEFVEKSIDWLPFHQGKSYEYKEITQVKKTYESLINKLDNLPDCYKVNF